MDYDEVDASDDEHEDVFYADASDDEGTLCELFGCDEAGVALAEDVADAAVEGWLEEC